MPLLQLALQQIFEGAAFVDAFKDAFFSLFVSVLLQPMTAPIATTTAASEIINFDFGFIGKNYYVCPLLRK